MRLFTIDPGLLQVVLILGPLLVSVIVGPLLVAMVNRAKSRAEAEHFEVVSDRARFEAMDLLVTHMREEMITLRGDKQELLAEVVQLRRENRRLQSGHRSV